MARFRSFAGGLAGGIAGGYKLGLEMEEAEERKKDRAQQRELGLEQIEVVRAQRRDREREDTYKREREHFLRDNTMERVLSEDAAGNITVSGYQPRQLNDQDMLRIHQGVAEIDYRYGKLDSEKAIAMTRAIKHARDEGSFDAYNEAIRTGDLTAAERIFSGSGKVKLMPGSLRWDERTDERTGQKYRSLVGDREGGGKLEFDPVQVGRAMGGAQAYAAGLEKQADRGLKGRQVAAQEQTAGAAVTTAEGTRDYRRDLIELRREMQNQPKDKPLTDRDKANTSLKFTNAAAALLRDTVAKGPEGIETKTPHPLKPYQSEITARANRLFLEDNVDPQTALETAMREKQDRVDGIEDGLRVALDRARKRGGMFAGDDPVRSMRSDINAMLSAGASRTELRRIAKQLGGSASEKLFDDAMNYEPKEKDMGGPKKPKPSGGGSGGRPSLGSFNTP